MSSPGQHDEISPLLESEAGAFVRTVGRAFGHTVDDETAAHIIALELQDPSRSIAARHGGRLIGGTTALDFTMTVPQAPPVGCAGVTSASVVPTHRRRGVLTGLMRRQLDDLHSAGTAWAALYATEAAIYGRFGYGVASRSLAFALDGPWTTFAAPVEPAAVEWLDVPQAIPRVAAIYERVRAVVPGMMSMSEEHWRLHLEWDRAADHAGASERQIAVVGDRAFALYRTQRGDSDTGPDGTLRVEQCMATDSEALRQLWYFLLHIDLVQHVRAELRPVDDPLPWWLAERRRLRVTEDVPCHVRLVDVGAALSQRGTTGTGAVVIDATDPFCRWNERRWSLESEGSADAEASALRCTPTTRAPDVALDVRELASLSLGGVSPFELDRAGLVEECTTGALVRLEALLRSRRAPWSAFKF